ncbi:5159_t:CDS:2 [Funneliformis geosporum]|nr:5159_t:CDS:2 [Funneliformis geosporum]
MTYTCSIRKFSDYERFCIPDNGIFDIGLPKEWKDFFSSRAEEINSKPKKADIHPDFTEELVQNWQNKGVELRDETDEYCENFAVIDGSNEEFLLFNSDFFNDTEYKNSFKKGKIYRFCFFGELKKHSDSVVNSVEEGDFEINEISEIVPFIRDTYKEKEKTLERKNIVEKELEEKNSTIQGINQERFDTKKELADLKIKFDSLQFEKTKLENERITPEKHQELLDIQKGLEKNLELIKDENGKLSSQLEKINKQD